jgi:tetratricopeptide (TPR) repeat protein
MKARDRTRFDIKTLRDLAGDKVFARGEVYHRDGQVVILSIEPERVLAQVEGTDDYRTELAGRGKDIDGECSCPAFGDWGFCKHMVAAALAANAAGNDAEVDGAGALDRIRDHLKKKGADALVEMIMEMAEQDPALFRRLDIAAATMQGDEKAIEARLRKAIDSATRTERYIDYREASGWAAGVGEALDAVSDLVAGGRGKLALKLVEHAIDRIERVTESIDDSDGHCGVLLDRACEIHLAAARAARPEPVQLARDLFARETQSDYGAFSGAVALYADVLGEEGLREYRRLASEAWEKLPPQSGARERRHEFSGNYYQLAGILDFFAERDGDVDARIALRAKNLSSPWSYLQLAEFCRSQGRKEEALRRAEEGLWLFEDDRPDERLVFFVVDLLSKAGRKKDAETHLWRTFEKAPSMELYKRLRKIGGTAARDRALKLLEPRLANEPRTRWHTPADLLIDILMHDKLFDAAWTTLRKHGASTGLRETLARASEATHPREALEVYAERVDQLADGGGNPAYGEAAKLIGRMAALRSATEQAAYVTALKVRFGRKRNFVRLLA